MIFRAVVFAAVSDPSQLKNDSIESQIERGQAVIRERGWREVHPPLEVPGISRSWDFLADAEREVPAIGALLQLVRDDTIDLVVVRRHNRLARTASLLLQISAYLRKHRVQIYAWEEPVEPVDPAEMKRLPDTTRLMVEGFSGLLAEADNVHRTQRNQEGMLTRIRRGGHPAGEAPFGYQDVIAPDGVGRSHRKRIVNPAEYPLLCDMLRMLKDGYSARQVAIYLNGRGVHGRRGAGFTPPTVLQWANNPYYYGRTYRGWHYIGSDGKRAGRRREPLVLVDSDHQCPMTWDDRAIILRNIAERDTVGPRAKKQARPWTGLARCGYCLDAGRPGFMRYRIDVHQNKIDKRQRSYEYLYCGHYSDTGGRGCQRNGIRVADFLTALYDAIARAASDPAALAALAGEPEERPDRTAQLAQALDSLGDEEQRWDEAYRAGVIDLDKYRTGLQELRQRRQRLSEELRREQGLRAAHGEVRRQRNEALDRFAETLARGDPADISRVVRQIVERVILRDGQLDIIWR